MSNKSIKPSRKSFEDLIYFCKLKEEIAVLQLLEEGAFVNDSDENGITPLHVASAVGAENIVKLLVLKGADVEKSTNLGWTPVMYAARNGHSNCTQQLIACGANIHQKNKFGISVLCMATASGNKELIEILLQATQRESFSENIVSPLHITALLGHFHILPSLLSSQIHQINKSDKHGITPLMLAAAGGHEDVIKILLDFGADTNLQNSYQFTALDIASTKQFKKIVHLLADKTKQSDNKYCKHLQSPEIGSDLIEQYGWSSVCTPKPRSYTWHSNTPKENTFNFSTSQISPRNSKIPLKVVEDRCSLFNPVCLPLNEFPQVSLNTSSKKNIFAEKNETCVPVPPVSPYNDSASPFYFPKTITPKKYHSLSSLNHYNSYHVKRGLKYSSKEENSSLQGSNGKIQGIRKLENWFHSIFTSWRKKANTQNKSSHCQQKTFNTEENVQQCECSQQEETTSRFQNNEKWRSINYNLCSPSSSLKNLLISHKLQTYIPLFVEHEVDMGSFLMLREEDMEEMGIHSPKSKSKLIEIIMNFQEES